MALRVLSERIMARGYESAVQRLMDGVYKAAARQPGFLSYEELNDASDHSKYVALTKWASESDLERWLQSSTYKSMETQMKDVLNGPTKYRILRPQKQDMFLL